MHMVRAAGVLRELECTVLAHAPMGKIGVLKKNFQELQHMGILPKETEVAVVGQHTG